MRMVMFVFWRQVRDCCCCCSSRIAFVFAGCAALQHRCPCKGRANAIHDAHASSSLPLAQLARKACDNGGPSSCVLGPLPKQHGAPTLSRESRDIAGTCARRCRRAAAGRSWGLQLPLGRHSRPLHCRFAVPAAAGAQTGPRGCCNRAPGFRMTDSVAGRSEDTPPLVPGRRNHGRI